MAARSSVKMRAQIVDFIAWSVVAKGVRVVADGTPEFEAVDLSVAVLVPVSKKINHAR